MTSAKATEGAIWIEDTGIGSHKVAWNTSAPWTTNSERVIVSDNVALAPAVGEEGISERGGNGAGSGGSLRNPLWFVEVVRELLEPKSVPRLLLLFRFLFLFVLSFREHL